MRRSHRSRGLPPWARAHRDRPCRARCGSQASARARAHPRSSHAFVQAADTLRARSCTAPHSAALRAVECHSSDRRTRPRIGPERPRPCWPVEPRVGPRCRPRGRPFRSRHSPSPQTAGGAHRSLSTSPRIPRRPPRAGASPSRSSALPREEARARRPTRAAIHRATARARGRACIRHTTGLALGRRADEHTRGQTRRRA